MIHLPQFAPIDSAADQSSQSPEGSLVDPTEDRLSQSLDGSRPDSEDDSLDTSLTDIPIEMEPIQLMNQLLTQLTTKPSTEIHPTSFTGTAADNILDWLENFDHIAAHNVWNDQKQLQVIPVYLKDTALNFYRSLPDQTKADINLLKAALRDRYHTQDRLYDMHVKLHELRQGSSLETYISDLDTLARHLELPEQQKIHYFIFGLTPKLKQALLIRQPQTYEDAVTFAKRKHHFPDTDSDTQLMDLLQKIRKEISLKHTGIKQEPYSAPVQNTHTNHLQQGISQLQTDIQNLKESVNRPHTQYAAPLDTNPITLQQQLAKMKENIKKLQQTKRPNAYPTPAGNYRSFRTTDGLVICRRYHQVGHFARACLANLPPPRAPTHYQNHQHNYVPPATSQHPRSSYALNSPLPPINILNALPIDHQPIAIILWDILTHKMPSIPIPHGDQRLSPPITPTTDTKLEGLTSQANLTIIIM